MSLLLEGSASEAIANFFLKVPSELFLGGGGKSFSKSTVLVVSSY